MFSRMTIEVFTALVIIFFVAPSTSDREEQIRRRDRDLQCNSTDSTIARVFQIGDDAKMIADSVGTTFRRRITSPERTNATDVSAIADNDIAKDHDHAKSHTLLSRPRRTLTFPTPATLLVTFGLGTPLQLDRESVILGAFAKFIYTLPSNSTDFTEPNGYLSRKKTRWTIYKTLERAAELYGFGDGKGCLLRAICDVASAPFDLHHGLFGQMVQAFLSPSSTSEPYDDYTDREYHAAESLGKHVGENCHALYPECERSVLDVFSTTATILGKTAMLGKTTIADKNDDLRPMKLR